VRWMASGQPFFPGLVKVSRNLPGPGVASGDTANTVVRRAQVICECALQAASYPGSSVPPAPTVMQKSVPVFLIVPCMILGIMGIGGCAELAGVL
jgi:hypothetical protein